MSDYNFILDGIKYSHSSASSFVTCPYGFKLKYIDALEEEGNFFSDYGTFIHTCMEKYFNNELEFYELSDFYKENYESSIKSSPPFAGMWDNYKNQGQAFFDNFSFPKQKYKILFTETKIDFKINEIFFTARPDLVLKNKQTKKNILLDYKTSNPFKYSWSGEAVISDKSKIEGYKRQMYLYTYAIKKTHNIPIDQIILWFPRANEEISIEWDEEKETESVNEIYKTVERIKQESVFAPNNTNPFFCNNLCSVRSHCEYRP